LGKTTAPVQPLLEAKANKDELPEAHKTVMRASYVDDMADSRHTVQGIKDVRKQWSTLFPKCGMNIRK
jgi:hypothetical protein